jgi:hypothetical protein
MARAYTPAAAALTLGVNPKWLDNVLSHHQVPGVEQSRQGIARRLSIDGIVVLALGLLLIQELGLPVGRAIDVAAIMASHHGRYDTMQGVAIVFELSRFRNELIHRLESAVEVAPAPRRGRPPTNKTGRLV